jgi:hypothetical protein
MIENDETTRQSFIFQLCTNVIAVDRALNLATFDGVASSEINQRTEVISETHPGKFSSTSPRAGLGCPDRVP